MKPTIEERIKAVFKDYWNTGVLLTDLVRQRHHPHEIVILTCARLDALANLAMTKKRKQRERFVSFLYAYSGRRAELERIAVPNLYFRLFLHYITLPATVPATGRMCALDATREATFLQFLVDSGVPIEEKAISNLLQKLSVWLQQKYRTTATQAKSKPHNDSFTGVKRHLERCSHSYRNGMYNKAVAAFDTTIRDFRLADILYRDYRSRSIHDCMFEVDERFFTEQQEYLVTRYHAWDSTRFLEMSFSAQWLLTLYHRCVERYERSLIQRKKLPLDLWVRLCDEHKEFEFLDQQSVKVGRDLRIRVER